MTTQTILAASAEELQLANDILVLTNCHTSGALSSDAAIDIFKRSGLSYTDLRDIWNIADTNSSGSLSVDELTVAIRLMGWVQAGEKLEGSLSHKVGPMPKLEGITEETEKKSPPPSPPSQQAQKFPPVSPEGLLHYKRTFLKAGPVDGLLNDHKTMDLFMASNLSYSDIWKINKLIHRCHPNALDFREFSLGLYLIHVLRECLIPSVPSSFPQEVYDQIPDLRKDDFENHSPPTFPRLPLSEHEAPKPGPKLQASASRSSFKENVRALKPWIITPQEKAEAIRQFEQVDAEHNGFIAGDGAARFFLTSGLSPDDLTRIWALSDLHHDNRMTLDGFSVALHLIARRLEGEELPDSIPASLLSPHPEIPKTPKILVPKSPNPVAKSKPPPPPPPKRNRSMSTKNQNGIISPSSVSSSPSLPSSLSRYTTPLSPPVPPKSPIPPRTHSHSFSASPTFNTPTSSRRLSKESEFLSPFEDHNFSFSASSSSSPMLQKQTPPPSLQPDNSNNEALEAFKKETARLSLQVEGLLSQLTAQNRLRDSNEALRNENDTLKSQLRDMERTVSEVLSASDLQRPQQEAYTQTIDRLTAELSNKITQSEDFERMLAVVTQEAQELRVSLRESQQALAKEQAEVEEHKTVISSQGSVISELKSRLSDMSKAMSQPSSTSSTNTRELRILIRDVTKENDALKSQVRNMEKSMEQMLLSTKSHALFDEVDRENKRLKKHVQDLEMLATQLQSSDSGGSNAELENLKKENVQMKSQLRDDQRAITELRSSMDTKISEMQQKIDNITHENNRLKMEAQAAANRHPPREDNSVPPPSYDDSFVIPP